MNNFSNLASTVGIATFLDYFIREFPALGRRIKEAKRAGKDIKSIYEELQSLDRKELERREKKASLVDQGYNPGISASNLTLENSAQETNPITPENVGKLGLGLMGATGLAALGLPLGRAAIQGELLPAQTQIAQQIPKQLPYAAQELIGKISPQEPSPESPQAHISPTSEANQAVVSTPEPLSQEEQAAFNIQERRKESDRLFDIATSPRMKQENMTPFMRIARSLVKNGKISDRETFDEFRKYWNATEGKPRGNSFVEFEKFRVSRPTINEPEKQKQTKVALQENPPVNEPAKQEKRIDPNARYPKEFFKNKKKEEIDAFANERLQEAFAEIEKGIASGEDYGVFHGDEWQAVGGKDVNEGAPNAPNEPKRNIGPGKKLIQVIEEHVPTRGLYQYYFNTPEKRKRVPFNKFSRGYEKTVEGMITKKTNPELYAKLQRQEEEFLTSISKNVMPKADLFDEMQDEIEKILFRQYDDEFEDYLTKMIKKLR